MELVAEWGVVVVGRMSSAEEYTRVKEQKAPSYDSF